MCGVVTSPLRCYTCCYHQCCCTCCGCHHRAGCRHRTHNHLLVRELEFEESDLRAESKFEERMLQLESMKGGKQEGGSGKEGKMFNNNYN